MEKIFRIIWNDELGQDWMNTWNLQLCLFSEEFIGDKARPLVRVEEIIPEKIKISDYQ